MTISKYRKPGWHNESVRHSLAAKGIRTRLSHSNSISGLMVPLINYAKPSVDLNKYKGHWYQISSFPAFFQEGCTNSEANYQSRNNSIIVTNTCTKNGKKSKATGTAKPTGKNSLAVSFAPFKLDNPFDQTNYIILYTDYKTSVVGSPDKKYLWILSRTKTLSPSTYQKLVTIAKNKGFDVTSRLVKQ